MTGIILLILRVAMTVALYALLAWAFWLMWRTLRQEMLFLSARKVAPLTLRLDHPEISQQVYHFTHGEVVVGRDLDCECVLPDETISARHLRLTFHHNQWWAEDLGSRNGTTLNESALVTPTILIHGDTFRCGKTTLMVILTDEIASTYDTLSDTETIL